MSCSGKRTALCQREAVPCEILHGIRGILNLRVCCMVVPTCAVSITLPVTKCPWLDLVGICKPQDSRRDVWEEGIMCCGANFICNSLTQEWLLGSGKRWLHKEPGWSLQRQYFLWDGTLPAWQEVENKGTANSRAHPDQHQLFSS